MFFFQVGFSTYFAMHICAFCFERATQIDEKYLFPGYRNEKKISHLFPVVFQ